MVVKGKYGLWVTATGPDAVTCTLAVCSSMSLPGPGCPAHQRSPRSPRHSPLFPRGGSFQRVNPYHATCAAAHAAGAAPIHRGAAGYSTKPDRDEDGIACEAGLPDLSALREGASVVLLMVVELVQ